MLSHVRSSQVKVLLESLIINKSGTRITQDTIQCSHYIETGQLILHCKSIYQIIFLFKVKEGTVYVLFVVCLIIMFSSAKVMFKSIE